MSSGRYQAYPEYQESGLAWLGRMPKKWDLRKAKHLFERVQRPVLASDGIVTAFRDGEVTLRSNRREDGFTNAVKEIGYQGVRKNDLLVHAMDGFSGAIGVSDSDGKCSPVCSVCVPRDESEIHIRYYGYLVRQLAVTDYITSLAKGIRERSTEFRFSEFSSLELALPSKSEQTQIAEFLDHETAKIDRLIEKQQVLIALLKEKRQAVISHAVTKGLNPSAPLKDSGIECLGQVPAHWVVCRLKHLKSTVPNAFVDGPFGSNLKSEHFVDDGEVYVIESNFATTGNIDTEKLKKITRRHFKTVERSSTKGGDIIIAKIGARYGSSSILPNLDNDAVVSGNSLKLTVNEQLVINEYANELLRFLKANDAMDEGVNTTAQPALSLGGLNNLPFLQVPLSEQAGIITHIYEIKAKFDALIKNAEDFVTLSNERRTALISAAVTGKIDVRHWQPPKTKMSIQR